MTVVDDVLTSDEVTKLHAELARLHKAGRFSETLQAVRLFTSPASPVEFRSHDSDAQSDSHHRLADHWLTHSLPLPIHSQPMTIAPSNRPPTSARATLTPT